MPIVSNEQIDKAIAQIRENILMAANRLRQPGAAGLLAFGMARDGDAHPFIQGDDQAVANDRVVLDKIDAKGGIGQHGVLTFSNWFARSQAWPRVSAGNTAESARSAGARM